MVDFHVWPELLQIFKCISGFTHALVHDLLIQCTLSSLPVEGPRFILRKLVVISEDMNVPHNTGGEILP